MLERYLKKRAGNEVEKIEEEFQSAYDKARKYLNPRKDEQSSVASDIISVVAAYEYFGQS